jgi:hypothetical protein
MQTTLTELERRILIGIFADHQAMLRLRPWTQEMLATLWSDYLAFTKDKIIPADGPRWLGLPKGSVAERKRISRAYIGLAEKKLIELIGSTRTTHIRLRRGGLKLAKLLLTDAASG